MRIEYKLESENPDDMRTYKLFQRATDMSVALWDIAYVLRKEVEYDSEAGKKVSVDDVFERICNILNKNNIDLDDLAN